MPSPLDLWLIAALGFLGSFGHCVGMCGPVTAAFALSLQVTEEGAGQETKRPLAEKLSAAKPSPAKPSAKPPIEKAWKSSLWFHAWLNVGRLLSYALVGAGIGALGSVAFAGGQMAGVGSDLRRIISIVTGGLLIWFGLIQASPGLLPGLPFLHPARQQQIHEKLTHLMMSVSGQKASQSASAGQLVLTPLLLGLLWGLIPCGFLYAGQLRAAETQSWMGGAAVMLAFGSGTLPAMLAMGAATSLLSRDRRSQLFRIGGWLTVVIGALLLLRTGDTMSDYSGHGALICLMLALIARPISHLWAAPLHYRRLLGVSAFALSVLHVIHMASHTWNWQLQAVRFMLREQQLAVLLGAIALLLLLPAALTSFDGAQKYWGNRWRKLHLLSIPALLLAAAHTVIIGSSYWGPLVLTWLNQSRVVGLLVLVAVVLGLRSPRLWSLLSLKKYYALPQSNLQSSLADADDCCDRDLPQSQPNSQPNSR